MSTYLSARWLRYTDTDQAPGGGEGREEQRGHMVGGRNYRQMEKLPQLLPTGETTFNWRNYSQLKKLQLTEKSTVKYRNYSQLEKLQPTKKLQPIGETTVKWRN